MRISRARNRRAGSSVDPAALRLVLGVGRSGTTWIANVLAHTDTPCRFFSEPLFHLKPSLEFQETGDHTAIDFKTRLPARHPLLSAYVALTARPFERDMLAVPTVLEQDDLDWTFCLVKEVHSLLAAPGILRAWKTPTVFVLRDPIYVIDSLFAAQTPDTIYLDHEVRAVQQDGFLNDVMPRRSSSVKLLFEAARGEAERKRKIIQKLLCVHLVQTMFQVVANDYPFTAVLWYEDCCDAPADNLRSAAATLSIPWTRGNDEFLAATTAGNSTPADPYSIFRDPAAQRSRPFAFLRADEVDQCKAWLGRLRAG